MGLPDDQRPEALFGLAETLQQWADALGEAAAKLPDDQLTSDTEKQATVQACGLYAQSASAYQQVCLGTLSPASNAP